ncbi:hypothetical protein HNR35_001007 [Borreliella spielmanii]|uniref:Uncharacterized protein n=1 Tax=Borreliella spielmanii TaxID=88916 RepID=A0ABR6P7K2_9SPIR|nr:hypothetical protein [Borreliella spielmanii]
MLIAKNDPENFKYLLYLEYFKFSEEEIDRILNLDAKDKFFKDKENENNFIVASLYSLTKEDFIILLNDFKILKNKKGEDYILSLIKGYENCLLGARRVSIVGGLHNRSQLPDFELTIRIVKLLLHLI